MGRPRSGSRTPSRRPDRPDRPRRAGGGRAVRPEDLDHRPVDPPTAPVVKIHRFPSDSGGQVLMKRRSLPSLRLAAIAAAVGAGLLLASSPALGATVPGTPVSGTASPSAQSTPWTFSWPPRRPRSRDDVTYQGGFASTPDGAPGTVTTSPGPTMPLLPPEGTTTSASRRSRPGAADSELQPPTAGHRGPHRPERVGREPERRQSASTTGTGPLTVTPATARTPRARTAGARRRSGPWRAASRAPPRSP